MKLFVCEERESGSLKLQSKGGRVLPQTFFVWVFRGWSRHLGLQFANYVDDHSGTSRHSASSST